MNRTYISPEEKVQHLSREYGKDFTINRGEAYLENGLYTALAMDLDNYSVLNKQIFLNLYQDKYTSDGYLYDKGISFKKLKPHLAKIVDLDDDIADFLIRRKQGNIVLELREKFSFQDQEKIEKRLIKNQNVDNFNKMFEVFTYHSKEEIKALLLTYGANPDILPK